MRRAPWRAVSLDLFLYEYLDQERESLSSEGRSENLSLLDLEGFMSLLASDSKHELVSLSVWEEQHPGGVVGNLG